MGKVTEHPRTHFLEVHSRFSGGTLETLSCPASPKPTVPPKSHESMAPEFECGRNDCAHRLERQWLCSPITACESQGWPLGRFKLLYQQLFEMPNSAAFLDWINAISQRHLIKGLHWWCQK